MIPRYTLLMTRLPPRCVLDIPYKGEQAGACDLCAEGGTLYHLKTTERQDGTASDADLVGDPTSHQPTTDTYNS